MKDFNSQDHYFLTHIVLLFAALALGVEVIHLIMKPLPFQQGAFLIFFSALTVLFLTMRKPPFVVMFLISTFTLITAWRLSALAGYKAVTWIYTLTMMVKLMNYLLLSYQSITQAKLENQSEHHHQLVVFEWQLLFIRLFIGFDLIPHFCEKLFAGPLVRVDDVNAFIQLGVPHPILMVLMAGFIEFAGAFSLSCGFMTRLGAICLSIYLMVATYMGHHFSKGFIWASPGGGWEYPVLWTVLILSFATFGAGDFSIDRYLKKSLPLPAFVRHLMGGRKG